MSFLAFFSAKFHLERVKKIILNKKSQQCCSLLSFLFAESPSQPDKPSSTDNNDVSHSFGVRVSSLWTSGKISVPRRQNEWWPRHGKQLPGASITRAALYIGR